MAFYPASLYGFKKISNNMAMGILIAMACKCRGDITHIIINGDTGTRKTLISTLLFPEGLLNRATIDRGGTLILRIQPLVSITNTTFI